MVTAKRGEAILSTAAVNRIGEDGVRSLETGGGITPKIIVMNPSNIMIDLYVDGMPWV